MLKIFLKGGKGSISVYVTVIMVPVIFFIGFLVDLSRIKFCGSQAVMAADNYGEAILTDYDNLLKELYGLFALTQNKAGTEALDRLDAYVKEYYMTSFQPNENRISFGHLKEFTATAAYEGWMPYQNARVSFEASPVEGATLSDPRIFNTQVGDFMKFRIVQTVGDDLDGIVQAIESVQNMDSNIKAVEKRDEITEKVSRALETVQDYYAQLEALWQYPDYIKEIDRAYSEGMQLIETTLQDKYSCYKAYMDEDPQAIEAALEHREAIKEAGENDSQSGGQSGTEGESESGSQTDEEEQTTVDELSEEEERLCRIDDDYTEHLGHSAQQLQAAFAAAEDGLTERVLWETELRTVYGGGGYVVRDSDGDTGVTVNIDNFDHKASDLQSTAGKLADKLDDLENLRSQLGDILQDEHITTELKEGIEQEMKELDRLFGGGSEYYTAENYKELAAYIASYSEQNGAYLSQAEEMLKSIRERERECIDSHPELSALPEYADTLDYGRLDAYYGSGYVQLHDSLQECFGNDASDSTKKEAQKKQDDADDLLDDVGDALEKDAENAGGRDIPSGGDFDGMGDAKAAGEFDITGMIGSASKNFESNTLADVGNQLLTKLYLVQYDFGMFTSRMTNLEEPGGENPGDGESVRVSLTGYPMAPNINYLYQSEIEYLLGGHNSSKENLNEARNKILAFRAVMNYASTYTVAPVNTAIEGISSAFAVVPAVGPLLKVTVAAALRLAVAGVETYGDWVLLARGEAVCVLKTEAGDLSVTALPGKFADGLNKLLGNIDTSGEKNGKFELDYEQYCMIMMLFLTRSEVLSQRSADLITLNVNTVKKPVGSDGVLSDLEFRMEDTVTAVDVTCAVQLDLVVMPRGFARSTVDADTYAAIEEFENNTYKFTVTRGY
ncbi:MAG: DUF5702 domain-containing protein [Blautia sp.]|nr:DUF5702 domain-containing protein [Blautia sp.]